MSTAIQGLSEVGLKAVEYVQAIDARKAAYKKFSAALDAWRSDNDQIGVIFDRGSEDWYRMMDGVAKDLDVFRTYKRSERNARERLVRAARKVGA